jgi:hypothetical protein
MLQHKVSVHKARVLEASPWSTACMRTVKKDERTGETKKTYFTIVPVLLAQL